MHIGIVGSREYPHLEDVQRLVALIGEDNKQEPGYVIVSGGAKGVDTTAETAALACGLDVVSYRVRSISYGEHAIEEWTLGSTPFVRLMTEHPTWDKYEGALFYRNILIAQKADRLVAFRAAWSPGTTFTMDVFKETGRPIREYGMGEERLVIA